MSGGRAVPRVVLAELDSLHPAAMRLARALRDEGAEVIVAGVLRTVGEAVAVVEQEDPDVLIVAVASAPAWALADDARAELAPIPVLTFETDTDVARWMDEHATCATGPSSQAFR